MFFPFSTQENYRFSEPWPERFMHDPRTLEEIMEEEDNWEEEDNSGKVPPNPALVERRRRRNPNR